MRSRNRTYSQRGTRRATTVVEMALAGMILVMLTMGVIEYGWLFLKQQQITNAARQAARIAATADATNTTVTASITSLMNSYGLGSSGYTTAFSPTDVSTASRGSAVSVTISITYSRITITRSSVLPAPTTITAQVSMQKEGA